MKNIFPYILFFLFVRCSGTNTSIPLTNTLPYSDEDIYNIKMTVYPEVIRSEYGIGKICFINESQETILNLRRILPEFKFSSTTFMKQDKRKGFIDKRTKQVGYFYSFKIYFVDISSARVDVDVVYGFTAITLYGILLIKSNNEWIITDCGIGFVN
jgi:hypothetical protein